MAPSLRCSLTSALLAGGALFSPLTFSQPGGPGNEPAAMIPHIFIAHADGSGVTSLTQGLRPDWSPDGARIAFYRKGRGYQEGDMYLVLADGTNEYVLGPGIEPAWSPDGERIVFISDEGIAVMDVCCPGNATLLLRHDFSVGLPYYEGGNHSESDGGVTKPDWSPDGKQIVFEAVGDAEWGTVLVWIMNADGTGVRRLKPRADFRDAESDAAWSPDGSKIALWSFDVGLHTVNPMSGTVNPIYFDDNTAVVFGAKPTWSPDGRFIAFRGCCAASEGLEIWVVASQGGSPGVLIPYGYEPDWSPDGKFMAFVSDIEQVPTHQFPPISGAASIYDRESRHTNPLDAQSRYVLYDDGTFELQYVLSSGESFSYGGAYLRSRSDLALDFEDDVRWEASGTFNADNSTLFVQYNSIMGMSDFEDGTYVLTASSPKRPVKEPDEPLDPPSSKPKCGIKCASMGKSKMGSDPIKR